MASRPVLHLPWAAMMSAPCGRSPSASRAVLVERRVTIIACLDSTIACSSGAATVVSDDLVIRARIGGGTTTDAARLRGTR